MTPVEPVIQRLVAAFNEGGVEHAVEYFHPEVRWSGDFLEGEPFIGHDGVREVAALFTGRFDDFHMEIDRVIELEDRALVLGHQTGRTKAGGELVDHMAIMFRERDGLISELCWYGSWEDGLEAQGLDADQAHSIGS